MIERKPSQLFYRIFVAIIQVYQPHFNMKRILPIVVFLFCAGSAFCQLNVWRWQNPLPEGNVLHAVQMVSLNVTYACGENGTFIRTSDAGISWDIQTNLLKIKTTFNSLSFFDQQYGMICGDSGRILKTTNSGSSWKSLGTTVHDKFNSIIVIDTNIALVVTMGGGILKTTNGGVSWFMTPVEDVYALYSINKLRPDFLTVTGYGGILLRGPSNNQGIETHVAKI